MSLLHGENWLRDGHARLIVVGGRDRRGGNRSFSFASMEAGRNQFLLTI